MTSKTTTIETTTQYNNGGIMKGLERRSEHYSYNSEEKKTMRIDKEMRTDIEEIARVCLEREEVCRYIEHELGLGQGRLDEIYAVLEGLLNKEQQQ